MEFIAPTLTLDHLSLFHASLLAAVFAGWIAIYAAECQLGHRLAVLPAAKSIGARLALAALGGSLAGLVIFAMHPSILMGALDTGIDPLYGSLRLHGIMEGQPIFSLAMVEAQGFIAAASMALSKIGVALVGAVIIFSVAAIQRRPAMIACAVWIVLFAGWQLIWKGWPTYYNSVWIGLFCGIGVAIVAARVASRFSSPVVQLGAGVALMIAMASAPSYLAAPPVTGGTKSCQADETIGALEQAGVGPGDLVALPSDFGPETIWRTGATVTSIPNHHFQPRFGAAYDLFRAPTDDAAKQIVTANGMTILVVCKVGYRDYYSLNAAAGDTFSKRIVEGHIPSWLEVVYQDGPSMALRVKPSR